LKSKTGKHLIDPLQETAIPHTIRKTLHAGTCSLRGGDYWLKKSTRDKRQQQQQHNNNNNNNNNNNSLILTRIKFSVRNSSK